jgi:GntR family transcriptional regulator, transcriptional repressor for pyruvate dehydrogenase complex
MNNGVGDRPVHRVGTVMRAPKTAELIATHLRRQIVKGELRPGETLPAEVHLMEQFSVSRPTLREAFRILEAESLIGVRRGSRGGAQVLDPDPRVAARHVGLLLQLQGTTVQDVYQARMVTEPACAAMFAARSTPEDVEDLRAVIDHLNDLVDAGFEKVPDPSEWAKATYRFHELILQRCGNKTLAIQGALLADIVDTHLTRAIGAGMRQARALPAPYQKTLRSYRKLAQLVEAHDSEGAHKHWCRHMEVAGDGLMPSDEKNLPVVDLFG